MKRMKNSDTILKHVFISVLVLLSLYLSAAFPEYKACFQKDNDGWTSAGAADYSKTGRRKGNGSLVLEISDANAKNVLPSWTSPLIPLNKEEAVVSFWTADNYLKLQDLSYSAALTVNSCTRDGKIEKELAREYTEWDTSLVSPYMWGLRWRPMNNIHSRIISISFRIIWTGLRHLSAALQNWGTNRFSLPRASVETPYGVNK